MTKSRKQFEEDPEIAEIARGFGASVPFLRPTELAADTTPGIDPVLHALDMLPGHDAVMLLQPTSPLREAADINAVLDMAHSTGAVSIVSVTEAAVHPAWMYRMGEGGALSPLLDTPSATRRQDLPPVHCLNGAIYFARIDWLFEHGALVGPDALGHVMPAERSIDIDEPIDWHVAELLLAERAGAFARPDTIG